MSNGDLSRFETSSNSARSDEIECQVGHYLDVIHRRHLPRRKSWHPDDSSGDIQFTSEYTTSGRQKKSTDDHEVEIKDISLIMSSELLKVHGTSWQAAVLIMANCTIGMGLLNFPHAVLNAGGILPAMMTQTVTLIFIIVSLIMMCHLSQYYGDVSFQGVIGSHLGHIGKLVTKVLIFVNNFATLIVFLVVIGDQIEHVLKSVLNDVQMGQWYTKRGAIVPLVSTVLIFPFCLCKRFDIFKYTSFLGVFAAIYVAFGLIMIRYFIPGPRSNHINKETSSPDLLRIIPLICFAYECHIEIPPMVACLKVQNLCYFQKMVFGYAILSCIVYSVSGVFGYLTFGQHTPDNIVLAYAPNDVLVIIALVLLSLKIITTYPVVFYCLRIVIEDAIRSHWYLCQSVVHHEFAVRLLISFVLFVSSVFLAVFVPNITSVINLIGGVSAAFIFILPGLCYLRLFSPRNDIWDWKCVLLGATYVTFGTFLTAVSTTQTFQEYLKY